MAQLDIEAKITAPSQISVALVREDELKTKNTFRLIFDVCLAIASALLGSMLSIPNKDISFLHITFFVVMVIGCIVFLTLSNKAITKEQ